MVNFSTDHILLTALDHRAATLEKLGQLQPALKDAKYMIDLKPGMAKVGSILDIYPTYYEGCSASNLS